MAHPTDIANQAFATYAKAHPAPLNITEALNSRGYSDISTVYAYYTAEEKAEHGKHCESWTCFSNHYPTGKEREHIASIAGPQFSHYLISWSGCD